MTDGRSDGQTESIIAKTALCIASYADALSKSAQNAPQVEYSRSKFEIFSSEGHSAEGYSAPSARSSRLGRSTLAPSVLDPPVGIDLSFSVDNLHVVG